jgi:hypothetical protein
MTGNVVDLASRRGARSSDETCPGCATGQPCFPHRLDQLADRLRVAVLDLPLLVAADDLERLVSDALEVIDGITSQCLPESETRPRRTR